MAAISPTEAGNRLKAWRESQGISATVLGERLGLAQSSVWRLEAGRTAFTQGVLAKLSTMGVSLDWLLMGIGEMPGVSVPTLLPLINCAAQGPGGEATLDTVEVPFYAEGFPISMDAPVVPARMVTLPRSMVKHPKGVGLWVVRYDDMFPVIQPGFTICACMDSSCWEGDLSDYDGSIVTIMTADGPRLRWLEVTRSSWVFSPEKEGLEVITSPRSKPAPILNIVLFWLGHQPIPHWASP